MLTYFFYSKIKMENKYLWPINSILQFQRKGNVQMSESILKIIPQQFSFEKPSINNGRGEVISPGINVSISIDAFQANKVQLKKDLAAIFEEVLEYFD